MAKITTTLESLRAAGFTPASTEIPKRLVANIQGREKTGKSHVSLTAPGPILYFDLDIGTEGVVEKFKRAGKDVWLYTIRVPKTAPADVYTSMWNDAKLKLDMAWQLGKGTVVIDTFTETYELSRLALLGKLAQVMPHQYAEVNTAFREFIRQAYDSPMNTIFIHKVKPKWVNNVRTAEYEMAGFGDVRYTVQINLRTERADYPDGKSVFSLVIEDCRHNPAYMNQVVPVTDFTFLLEMIHGK